MPHRIRENIEVQTAGGIPQEFTWRGQRYRVSQVLEWWKESGCWWDNGPARLVFRVSDAVGQTYELHEMLVTLFESGAGQLPVAGKWMIHCVED